jgi:hypothetical protein
VSCQLQWYTACSPGVLAAVDAAVESLVKLGAAIVDIHIPELDQVQVRDKTRIGNGVWSFDYTTAVFMASWVTYTRGLGPPKRPAKAINRWQDLGMLLEGGMRAFTSTLARFQATYHQKSAWLCTTVFVSLCRICCRLVCCRLHMLAALPLSTTTMLGWQGGGITGACANRCGFMSERGAAGASLLPMAQFCTVCVAVSSTG